MNSYRRMIRYFLFSVVLITQCGYRTLLGQQVGEYEGLRRRVVTLYEEGKYKEAIPLAERARQVALATTGVQSSPHSRSLNNLALLYLELGRYQEAEPLLRQALEINKRVLGEEHPDYATSLVGLADLYRTLERYEEAEPLFREALDINRRMLGEEHPHYATSLVGLAMLYRSMGRYEEALPLHRQALDIRGRVLGEDHPDYATSLYNLAVLYSDLGRYEEAEPLYRQALDIRGRVLGEDHPIYATSLNNLAVLYRTLGRYEEAEPLYRQALDIRGRVLGEDHPDYATTLNNLADLYRTLERYEEAEPLYRQALGIRGRVLGEDDPHYATSLVGLAMLYMSMGRYKDAEPLFQQTVENAKRIVGEDHPKYSTILNNLAYLYSQLGRYEEAEPLYRQALGIGKRILGEDHPGYATSLSNLADLYKALGRYEEAEPLFRQALDIKRRVLGEDHPKYATTLNNLAALYMSLGRHEDAESHFRQALDLRRRVLGEDHPDYATSLNDLFLLYHSLGRYEEAEPLVRQASEIAKRTLGEDHPIYATTLNNLAGLHETRGRYEEAGRLYRQASDIRRRVLGEEHPGYANSLNNLAELYRTLGRYEEALPLHRQALDIRGRVLGEDHPDYAVSLNNLAVLYRTLGRYEEALPLHRQALAIAKRTLGEDHPTYASGLDNLAVTLATTGRTEQARQHLEQALAIEQHLAREVFAFSSESAMRAFVAKRSGVLENLTSLSFQDSEGSAATASLLTAVLTRKGMVFDSLLAFRRARRLLSQVPEVARQAAALRARRQRFNDLALPPPGADPHKIQQDRETLRREIDRLESELNRTLAQQYPQSIAERVDVEAVRRRLPRGSVLIELLRSAIFDFKAERWKLAHYLAFALHPDTDRAPKMIDLGEAAEIDEVIADLREHNEYFNRKFVRVSGAYSDNSERLPLELQELERNEEATYRSLARDLYQRVFQPLRETIGEATAIYLAPDGELNRIAFETLVDEEGRYLVESYRFAYPTTGRDLLREPDTSGKGTVVFADPDYDLEPGERRELVAQLEFEREDAGGGAVSRDSRGLGRWKPLPGTRQEGESIGQELEGTEYRPVTLKMGRFALEEELKAVSSPRILVLSTHGFTLPDERREDTEWRREQAQAALMMEPSRENAAARGLALLRGTENPMLRSGFVLAGANRLGQEEGQGLEDGWVTAQEVAMLDLRGTELVVASACDSGLGRVEAGEGVHGLRRAFLHAGAQSVLISLYKVPDAETQRLIGRFFGRLKEGRGKLESLRETQLEIIRQRQEDHGAAHPFFWGSFVLVGKP